MITKVPRKNLAVERPETILQKHPSAKALCDENGEILTPSDTIKNEILTFNIDSNKHEDSSFSNNDENSFNLENNEINKEDEKEMKITNNKETFFIQISTCEHKKINEKESFYMEAPSPNNNSSNNIINKNRLLYNCNNINNIYCYDNINCKSKNNGSNNSKNLLSINFFNNNDVDSSFKGLNLSKPLFYGFDSGQNNFDKEITKDISEGKDYKIIENKFLNVLKKQK